MKAPAITLAATLMLAPAFAPTFVRAATVDDLLAGYRAAGAGPFSAEAGQAMWSKSFPHAGESRRCATCHTEDLRRTGRHAQTGKPIDPMAPSANAKRLTDPKFVEKWLKRNCTWTLGRECTPQEKGDFLSFIRTQ